MPLHQNGAKSLSEMPLLHQDVLTEKKVRINPKYQSIWASLILNFFSTWLVTGRMLEDKEQLSVQKLELTFYSVTVLDVVSEESL